MMVKRISFLILLLFFSILTNGCSSNESDIHDVTGSTIVKQTIVSDEFNMNGSGVLNCSTLAYANEGIDVDLKYTLKYERGNILELFSIQKVISDNQESLDLYENAYLKIMKNYEDLQYYDCEIVREKNTVTYTTVINYDTIDVEKLLDIEGAEDNIIKNGKAKLALWLDLAEKIGTVCEEA